MFPNLRSPVQVQNPVNVPERGNGWNRSQRSDAGRRRIYVQVDTGNVLGLEVDRTDKVQTVKKKVQAALYIPTEQSDLVFGDNVLEDDIREVRNETPLLLTRSLYRTSSSPCMSPTIDTARPKNWSEPLELVGNINCCRKTKKLIRESVKALESGIEPVAVGGGLGGAYFFRNRRGESIGILKPTDEEPFAPNNPKGFVGKVLGQPGLRRSIRVGESGIREVAAYLLDHNHLAKVPPTALVKVSHSVFNGQQHHQQQSSSAAAATATAAPVFKIASFQQFVKHDSDANDFGTSGFPVADVHGIGILDVRIFNTDRHAGNILVKENNKMGWKQLELVPIDHGLCLPETLEDPYFEWLHWPQASMAFSEEEMSYIRGLDPYKDVDMIRKELPMIREACLRMLVLSTTLLKVAADAGLCLAEIGSMMSRQLRGMDEEASELERICVLAKLQVEEELMEQEQLQWEKNNEVAAAVAAASNEDNDNDDDHQFQLDDLEAADAATVEEDQLRSPSPSPATAGLMMSTFPLNFSFQQATAPLRPLEEDCALVTGTADGGECRENAMAAAAAAMGAGKSSWRSTSFRISGNPYGAGSGYRHSRLRQQQSGFSLQLSEMDAVEWGMFMRAFEVVLADAIANRNRGKSIVTHVQRFGTSCQF